MTQAKQKKATLAGILVADQWAEDGEITGFALCTDDERKYTLNCCIKKNNLILMLHQHIRVSGTITGDADTKSIKVTALTALSSEEIAERDASGEAFCC